MYKFGDFKDALSKYNILPHPKQADENLLRYRELITDGVNTIGVIDYSIHDYIEVAPSQKKHNYYFTINATIGESSFSAKSFGYFKEINVELMTKEIDRLRQEITSNKEYQRLYRINQLK